MLISSGRAGVKCKKGRGDLENHLYQPKIEVRKNNFVKIAQRFEAFSRRAAYALKISNLRRQKSELNLSDW